MSEELTKVELYGANNDGQPRRYTIASDAVITKGQLLALTDPRTVTAITSALGRGEVAGVAAEGHDGLDFSNSISVWTDGIFDAYASGSITIGTPLQSGSVAGAFSNRVMNAGLWASGAEILGYALEACSANEVINIRLQL